MAEFKRQTIQEQITERLVSDPYASEDQWLPAFNGQSKTTTEIFSSLDAGKCQRRSLALPLAIAASCIVSAIVTSLVQMGYDLGYRLIEALFTQTAACRQGTMALNSLAFMVIPITFGLSFGALKARWQGSPKLWSLLGVIVPAIFAFVMAQLSFGDELSGNNLFRCGLWIVVAISSSILAICSGERLFAFLRRRMQIARLLMTSTLALAPFALAAYALQAIMPNSGRGIIFAEVALYLAAVLVPAYIVAKQTRVSDRFGAMLAGALGLMPLLLCNLLNVACNLLSLSLDTVGLGADLSWHALASAMTLSGMFMIALSAGSSLAWTADASSVRISSLADSKK